MGSIKPELCRTSNNSAKGLRPLVFSTRDSPGSERLEAWRAFMAGAIEIDVSPVAPDAFIAEQTVWDFGRFALTRAVFFPGGPVRTWRHLRRQPLDHWCLVLVPGIDGGAPSLFLRSLADSFEGHGDDRRVISLYIPRDSIGRITARLDPVTGELARSTMVDLLGDYLLSLEQRLASCETSDVSAIVRATEAIMVACLSAGSAEDIAQARDTTTLSLVERARRIIRRDFFSLALSPDALARSLGISRSGLYRAFEPYGGVRQVIQEERLAAAHSALADPERTESIVQIAESCGFSDASGFSRAFRRNFGYSPSQVRASGAGVHRAGIPAQLTYSSDGGLGQVLRRLHA